MEYCITVNPIPHSQYRTNIDIEWSIALGTINPIPHSQYRTKFDYEWSIEYQLMRNPLVSINIRSASLLIFKILYYGM